MDVTAADIAKIPAGNLRVPREEFVALWRAAEQFVDAKPSNNWYGTGVVMTCRWIACATVRPTSGEWRMARSPVTQRQNLAYEELIAAECLAAETLAMTRPAWIAARDTWIDAVVATLNWVWRAGAPPLRIVGDVPAAH